MPDIEIDTVDGEKIIRISGLLVESTKEFDQDFQIIIRRFQKGI